MSEDKVLKPCPFCGAEAELCEVPYEGWTPSCTECCCGLGGYARKEEAIWDWNNPKAILDQHAALTKAEAELAKWNLVGGIEAACARAEKAEADSAALRERLQELFDALDAKTVQFLSDMIGGGRDVAPHPWHEEWLHHARRAALGEETTNG